MTVLRFKARQGYRYYTGRTCLWMQEFTTDIREAKFFENEELAVLCMRIEGLYLETLEV